METRVCARRFVRVRMCACAYKGKCTDIPRSLSCGTRVHARVSIAPDSPRHRTRVRVHLCFETKIYLILSHLGQPLSHHLHLNTLQSVQPCCQNTQNASFDYSRCSFGISWGCLHTLAAQNRKAIKGLTTAVITSLHQCAWKSCYGVCSTSWNYSSEI